MDIVANAAQKYSHNPALINEKKTLSFRDLEAVTGRIATVLQRQGIRKGDIVTLCMPNSATMVLLLLALLKTGSVAAPLNYRFPASRLQTLFPLLKSTALIGPQSLTNKLAHPVKLIPEEIMAESSAWKRSLRQQSPFKQSLPSMIQQTDNSTAHPPNN
ncbi:AMP-binding protein [Prosthecochloris sp. SCSIO W1101]|uniref:AMP-binding protein n=1 Tax=Prosthecochloris sp. SCSIO W1101 TaxID=2992242 RepID=UPI00223CB8E7|nr:AMP-binding protein [Prosthecochloris sp. SCSIO W1101]UZJ41837.1 AMP-binding protein [Prosthecochloris sp. SCSIO W1101]